MLKEVPSTQVSGAVLVHAEQRVGDALKQEQLHDGVAVQ